MRQGDLSSRPEKSHANDDWFALFTSWLAMRPSFLDLIDGRQSDHDAMKTCISNKFGIPASPRGWTPREIGERPN